MMDQTITLKGKKTMNNQLKKTEVVVEGSIKDVAEKKGISEAEVFLDVQYVAIVDTSSSMGTYDAEGGLSRWDVAVQTLNSLQKSHPGKWLIIDFNSDVVQQFGGVLRSPSSLTDLTSALLEAKTYTGLGIEFYLISDGEPNDKFGAEEIARQFSDKINVICVGDATGSEFMKNLAALTGGVQVDVNKLSETHLLTAIRALLGDGGSK